ncbi:hypothetical protein MHU86_16865 [Fragilaria crotonensis]|nr:hypothetical protein MHU86_16865 [Fragilaria crotonensis]
MTLIFRHDLSSSEKIATILKLTRNHALSLATFAAIYKTILALLKSCSKSLHSSARGKGIMSWIGKTAAEAFVGSGRRLDSKPGFPERSHHALIAGAIGGYFVWGRYDKINVQINLYLFSRVVIALGKKYGWNVEASTDRYAWFSAVVWGIVMFLFEDEPDSLHSSLKMSMDEIYRYNLPASTL